MSKMRRTLVSRTAMVIFILVLGACPVWATVAGDIAAGVPLDRVIANGLRAGPTIETILTQALDAGAKPEDLFKAALAQGTDLTKLFKFFLNRAATDPMLRETYTECDMMKWAEEMGKGPIEIANAMMAAGGDLKQVRDCLASMGVPDAETYAYSPPGPPLAPAGVGPTFPGGGGGGPVGGGGGVASPAQ